METLFIARHAHAVSNLRDVVSCTPPGEGLSEDGRAQAVGLRRELVDEPIELGIASRLARAQETLRIALEGRAVPHLVLAGLDDIHFGSFDDGPLSAYRAWAWESPPEATCPGGGESRVAAALRFAGALDALLAHEERVVLAISHGLPIRYIVDAAAGIFPASRIGRVPHASAVTLSCDQVTLAARTLRLWAAAPRFTDASDGV